jgi:hypothetical protein
VPKIAVILGAAVAETTVFLRELLATCPGFTALALGTGESTSTPALTTTATATMTTTAATAMTPAATAASMATSSATSATVEALGSEREQIIVVPLPEPLSFLSRLLPAMALITCLALLLRVHGVIHDVKTTLNFGFFS